MLSFLVDQSVVDVIKLFWSKPRKSRFIPKLNQQGYATQKQLTLVKYSSYLEKAFSTFFVQVQNLLSPIS